MNTLGEDSLRIHADTLGEDLQDFGRGFTRIRKTLGEDSRRTS